jgi:hypothetical protein
MGHVAWVEEKIKAYRIMVGKHDRKVECEDNVAFEVTCGYRLGRALDVTCHVIA